MLSYAEYQEVLQMRREFTALRADFERTKAKYYSLKAGFRSDQPRWPKGSGDESGRWSGGAGAETPSEQPSANPKSGGHHFVPGELYRNEPLRPETRKVFEGATTGPFGGEPHRYDKDHIEYNKAVIEKFERFKAENGIAGSEEVTPDQAKKFLDEVRTASDPRIRGYNMKIFMRQFRFFMRGGSRGTE